jgi:N-methylhydantoinase B/oxoprolinase/acetone carboxylase alpha subunit
MEMEAPLRVHRIAIRPDSGGAGKHRGGLGVVKEYEILSGEVRFTHRGERHMCAAQGFKGGEPGAMAVSAIFRADGREETIPSKAMALLHKGDRVVITTAGGGGNGAPSARDPGLAEADIQDGKVSAAPSA